MYNLKRFIDAQERDYETALKEIKSGRKRSHWIWYIFPQLKGLGSSMTANYYGIENEEEARLYIENEYLRNHLLEITKCLYELNENDISFVMGYPDDLKLKSSMTLFDYVSDYDIFYKVLEKYYKGQRDEYTLRLINK